MGDPRSEPRTQPRLPMLVITDFSSPARRPHVVISARVHPGEAPASYMMRGVLQAPPVMVNRVELGILSTSS